MNFDNLKDKAMDKGRDHLNENGDKYMDQGKKMADDKFGTNLSDDNNKKDEDKENKKDEK